MGPGTLTTGAKQERRRGLAARAAGVEGKIPTRLDSIRQGSPDLGLTRMVAILISRYVVGSQNREVVAVYRSG